MNIVKKNLTLIIVFLIAGSIYAVNKFFVEGKEPWTEKQLMQPANLAKILNDPSSKKPLLFSIGFGGGIKGSVEMGPARDKTNLDKFKEELKKLSKDTDIVIYCGCCPFANCPNVRPAFKALEEMKFTNAKLLNLSTNLKTDWVGKGYPMNE